MKFSVGDKVRVKTDLVVGKKYNGISFIKAMEESKGKIFTIISRGEYNDKTEIYLLSNIYYEFTIDMLEALDDETPKQFTKADLKSKMVVETRNGYLFLVVENILVKQDGFMLLDDIKEDLTHDGGNKYDIMAVYYKKNDNYNNCNATSFEMFMEKNELTLIWQRLELKEISEEELAKLGYKYVRNKNEKI